MDPRFSPDGKWIERYDLTAQPQLIGISQGC
jgi:hypothetical protein